MTKDRVEYLTSAGGVVYRRSNDVEILLCGWGVPRSWALPKGTPNAGETVEATAVREVTEETGCEVEIQGFISTIHYWFISSGVRFEKTVHFFLMHVIGGSLENHDHEFDEVRWFRQEKAMRAMVYPSEIDVVQRAIVRIERGFDFA